jgi:hypothetical protein
MWRAELPSAEDRAALVRSEVCLTDAEPMSTPPSGARPGGSSYRARACVRRPGRAGAGTVRSAAERTEALLDELRGLLGAATA